jgi:hypothetical protein
VIGMMDPALHQDCSPGRLSLIVGRFAQNIFHLGLAGDTSIVQRNDKPAGSGGQPRERLLPMNLLDPILHGLLASGTGHIHIIVA